MNCVERFGGRNQRLKSSFPSSVDLKIIHMHAKDEIGEIPFQLLIELGGSRTAQGSHSHAEH